MSDIGSGTNEKLPDLPKFCLVCPAGRALNNNTVIAFLSTLILIEAHYCCPAPPVSAKADTYHFFMLTKCQKKKRNFNY